MMLADMGADVIKIETPGEGDPVRRQGVVRYGLSWYFAGFNRDKRSLTLNLRHHEGCAVLEKLIAGSDVLVENFRPGVGPRRGVGVNLCIDPPPPQVPNYRQSDLPPTGHHFISNRAQPASLRSLPPPGRRRLRSWSLRTAADRGSSKTGSTDRAKPRC